MKPKRNMLLKTRISIAFLVIILIPVLVTGIVFACLTRQKIRQIGERYGIDNPRLETMYDATLMISNRMDEKLAEIRQSYEEQPELLEDNSYLNAMNSEAEKEESFLVVIRSGEIFYNGSETFNDQQLLETLPEYGEGPDGSGRGVYFRTQEHAIVKQMDFTTRAGEEASLFLITRTDRQVPEVRTWLLESMLLIVLILSVTSLIMSVWIYRGISGPLSELKKATRRIRDGNLDFKMHEESSIQELTELTEDFEEMRARLRDSAEQKVDTDKESKELISNISHDLKTPITAIKGYVEGIMDGVADTPEKMDRYVRTIYNKANDMDRLIDELTIYAKIDTNRIPYSFARIPIGEYFTDCVEDLTPELQEQGVDLVFFNYLQNDAIVIADAEQLKRVINNIISNAVKYMDKPRGVINIRLRDVGDFVQAEIEDNGRGIAQRDLARIFDRFYRADASRNSRVGGSGIGLSIVRKILEDHEGKVWATSKEGVGTTIYFVLRKYQEPVQNDQQQEVQG